MALKSTNKAVKRKVHRSGVPLMIYFRPEQATQLKDLAERRRIPRANIVRFAVERLFEELSNGQMDLPLGLSDV